MNPGHVSAFDLFSIGVGPSSSHTVGPMRAARRFAVSLEHDGALDRVERVTCHLFGSLGATGGGHGTLPAVVAGLAGHDPETVAPEAMARGWAAVEAGDGITLKGGRGAEMAVGDFELQPGRTAGRHVNSLRLEALGAGGALLRAETFYSTGGGFVESEHDPVGGGLD
ncbi:MAG: L-serine ammonia-lyase, partial [Bifidobacteriaceae bacterium]|nr:L-serine ammonia-lyase [Bifidobacteriaceae bacterium]